MTDAETAVEADGSPPVDALTAEQERQQAERRAQVLAEHGSEAAILRPCQREDLLRNAVRGYVMASDVDEMRKGSLFGWDGGAAAQMRGFVAASLAEAYPMPATLQEAWAELSYWEKRAGDRAALDPTAVPAVWTRGRQSLLADELDTLPGCSLADIETRLVWLTHALGMGRDTEQNQACVAQLGADIRALAGRQAAAPHACPPEGLMVNLDASISARQPAVIPDSLQGDGGSRRTNADKRRAVVALLGDDLTDREIARRAGVSPQFVGNLRRGK